MARNDEAFPAPTRVERDNYRSSSIFPRSDFMPAIGRSRSNSEMGHSRPDWAVRVMSGLPPGVATVGADIPVRQLRANNRHGLQQQTWPLSVSAVWRLTISSTFIAQRARLTSHNIFLIRYSGYDF